MKLITLKDYIDVLKFAKEFGLTPDEVAYIVQMEARPIALIRRIKNEDESDRPKIYN